MDKIQRFDPGIYHSHIQKGMVVCNGGDYVKYTDYIAEITKLRQSMQAAFESLSNGDDRSFALNIINDSLENFDT